MKKRIDVLNHGFVELVDHMGSDRAIEEAARVSYEGTRQEERLPDETRNLLRYLMRHRHTSPFEMVELKFVVKCPIFVWRQWIRHRTANVNEISGRYAELPADFYVPEVERMQVQSTKNHQGSGDRPVAYAESRREILEQEAESAFSLYQGRLNSGLAKELARINLPLSTYTEAYWKIDLHNLFHFLKLRLDSHAQYEIRVYAEAIVELVRPIVPFAWEAFEDYVLNAQTFSGPEMAALRVFLDNQGTSVGDQVRVQDHEEWRMSEREVREFRAKLGET